MWRGVETMALFFYDKAVLERNAVMWFSHWVVVGVALTPGWYAYGGRGKAVSHALNLWVDRGL
jgi:hypothetical protein